MEYTQVKETTVKGEEIKPNRVRFEFGGKLRSHLGQLGIEGEGRESKIEDRRLTGIIPIRAAPWVSFVPHLVAGVLAGVREEVALGKRWRWGRGDGSDLGRLCDEAIGACLADRQGMNETVYILHFNYSKKHIS